MTLSRSLQFFIVPPLLAAYILLPSCNSHQPKVTSHKAVVGESHSIYSNEEAVQRLSTLFPSVDTSKSSQQKAGMLSIGDAKRLSYTLAGHEPIWVEEDGVNAFAKALLDDLDSLATDGINPERYHISALRTSFQGLTKGGSLDAAIAFDTACTTAYLQASRDLLLGMVTPKKADSLWYHANDSVWTGPRLLAASAKDGAYIPLNTYRSTVPTYHLLRQEMGRYKALGGNKTLVALKSSVGTRTSPDSVVLGIINRELPWVKPEAGDSVPAPRRYVMSFQEYYGLAPTGKIDSTTSVYLSRQPDSVLPVIAANLERIRWMPQKMEDQYVLVDIPLMELFFRRGGQDAFHMRVVVGKPSRQTPVLSANMANVVFSPGWGVPPTILKQDVLPGIQRRGSSYLAKKGLRAYDRHGRQVSAGSINSRNYRNYTFKQPPGARNALGEVKFNLPNPWDIYLHDTPHREDFPKRYRAKSSGCIRVEKPKEFAGFILNDIEGRQFDSYKMDSIIDTRKTRFETLKQKIPVHILYLTAFEDSTGSRARFIQDIYHRDNKLIAALANQNLAK